MISGTDKTDYRKCENIYVISHAEMIAFQPIAKFMKTDILFRLKRLFII